jgi:hypothetical protein
MGARFRRTAWCGVRSLKSQSCCWLCGSCGASLRRDCQSRADQRSRATTRAAWRGFDHVQDRGPVRSHSRSRKKAMTEVVRASARNFRITGDTPDTQWQHRRQQSPSRNARKFEDSGGQPTGGRRYPYCGATKITLTVVSTGVGHPLRI